MLNEPWRVKLGFGKEVSVRKVLLSLTWTVAALVALAVAAGGSFTW